MGTAKPEQQRLGLSGGARTGVKADHKPFVPGPNPELPAFIKQHSTPYNPKTDKHSVKAFDRDLIVHKHNKLYSMHMYWSKKDPLSIAEYVKHYTKPGDLVFDPFAGTGSTGCAALLAGRNAVLVDVSPSAGFIAYHYNLRVSPDDVEDAVEKLLTPEKNESIARLYKTKCDRCAGDAITEFVVWSDCYQCPACAKVVALFDCPEVSVNYSDGSTKTKRVCTLCLQKFGGHAHERFVISTRSQKFEPKPVACKYICLNQCKPKGKLRLHNDPDKEAQKYFTKYDKPLAERISRKDINIWYPKRRMMDVPEEQQVWGVKWRSGTANYKVVADLFTNRNLLALAELRKGAKAETSGFSPLIFLTWLVHKCSNLMGYGADGVGRIGVGTYYMPPIRMEARPTKYLAQAKSQILAHFTEKDQFPVSDAVFCLSIEPNVAACARMPSDSIDYIFTDPPYLNLEVQYGELNFLWDAWLDFPNSLKDEITWNPIHNHAWPQAEDALRQSVFGMFRVLKPGHWASICYHDTSESNWTMLQKAVLDAGFEIHTVTCLEPRSKSRKAITSEKIVKSDLVLNCRKPKFEQERTDGNGAEIGQVTQRVRDILVETLSTTGGQTRDKLWDIVLRRLLARGEMAEHRFDDILSEICTRSEASRWFLKEEFESLSDNDLRNEEEAGRALERFVHFRSIGVPVALAAQLALSSAVADDVGEDAIENHIKREVLTGPEAHSFKLAGRMKGCEFYDCLFFYLTRYLKGRAAGRTPRRNLAEFLEEYVVRFRDGDKWLYRQPTSTEAESLKKSRQSGLGRRIRQFAAFLAGEGDFPKERMPDAKTMVAWLKHCANFGLAEAGVVLYEKGGLMGQLQQLTDDERYDAEEYYATCRRNAGKKAEDEDEVVTETEEEGKES